MHIFGHKWKINFYNVTQHTPKRNILISQWAILKIVSVTGQVHILTLEFLRKHILHLFLKLTESRTINYVIMITSDWIIIQIWVRNRDKIYVLYTKKLSFYNFKVLSFFFKIQCFFYFQSQTPEFFFILVDWRFALGSLINNFFLRKIISLFSSFFLLFRELCFFEHRLHIKNPQEWNGCVYSPLGHDIICRDLFSRYTSVFLQYI